MKSIISIIVLFLFLEGGGVITFITRSDDSWYFQNNTVEKLNDETRKVINPVVVNGSSQYQTNVWFFN